MKLLVILLIFHIAFTHLVSAGFASKDLIRFQKKLNTCKREHQTSDGIIERVLDGELIDEPNFNCFLDCMLQGLELLKSDGTLDIELAKSKIPPEAKFAAPLLDALQKCSSQKDDDKCQTAHLLFVCMHEQHVRDLLLG